MQDRGKNIEMETYIRDLKPRLLYEFTKQKKGGIYGFLQKLMAYNSNKIEGSTLTEKQTASMFETGTIMSSDEMFYRTKDIEETTGHFRMFNNVLRTIQEPLSVNLLKTMHYDLKVGVFEDLANGYPCGEYKNRVNKVSDIETVRPSDVAEAMDKLIKNYSIIDDVDISVLARFHAEYERIHPFQDGNGRTGRMILFRESLKHDMVPIIVYDEDKAMYYNCLNHAQNDNKYDYLISFFEKQQKRLYDETKDMVVPLT